MEPRSLAAVLPAGGETTECHRHECSMLVILRDVQSLVERSNIINVSIYWFSKELKTTEFGGLTPSVLK